MAPAAQMDDIADELFSVHRHERPIPDLIEHRHRRARSIAAAPRLLALTEGSRRPERADRLEIEAGIAPAPRDALRRLGIIAVIHSADDIPAGAGGIQQFGYMGRETYDAARGRGGRA